MLRLILIQLALFSAPFVLYAAYRFYVNRQKRKQGEAFNERTFALLILSGLGLVILSLLWLGLSGYG